MSVGFMYRFTLTGFIFITVIRTQLSCNWIYENKQPDKNTNFPVLAVMNLVCSRMLFITGVVFKVRHSPLKQA